jgi:hypothetical protein
MRSHERTLLSSLGFNDPDKGDPRHDLACRYIAQPEIAAKVMGSFSHSPQRRTAIQQREESEYDYSRVITFQRSVHEAPLSKGEGQYKVTVGFVDVYLIGMRADHCKGRARSVDAQGKPCGGEWKEFDDRTASSWVTGVEVKIGNAGAGDIIRQVNLYREYAKFDAFVVVTAFPLSEGGADQLRSAGIRHFVLGKGFERFCAIEDAKAPAQSPEL